MGNESVLETDNSGISQVRMAALQKESSAGCFDYPVVVDEATLDSLSPPHYPQVIVVQYTVEFVFNRWLAQSFPLKGVKALWLLPGREMRLSIVSTIFRFFLPNATVALPHGIANS